MSSSKIGSVKIPMFDRENYELWKRKMLLFLQVANAKFLKVLKTGPIVPMIIEIEKTVDGVTTPGRHEPKDVKDYNATDIEEASLDLNLQLILVESLDSSMYCQVVNCKTAQQIWDTIETINEGTEEVRENRMEILMSEYEHFQAGHNEGISEVFQRYNKLINSLNLHEKFYTLREINRKFLMTLPPHLEHRVTAIRESRDLNEISLERLYGILKTYELEQLQQKELYGKGRVASTSAALSSEAEVAEFRGSAKEDIICEYGQTPQRQSNCEFYSHEELEQLEDESMALFVKKFGNFRFRRNPNLRFKSSSSGDRDKSGDIDRNKISCFNCGQKGHLSTECLMPKQVAQKKSKGQAYVAKDKCWDDTDSDEEATGDLALMADTKVHVFNTASGTITMTDADLIRNLDSSLGSAQVTISELKALNAKLKNEVFEVNQICIIQDEQKKVIFSLEHKLKMANEREDYCRKKIVELESKVNGYYKSAKTAKEILDATVVCKKVGLGYDYNLAMGKQSINTFNSITKDEKRVPHVLLGIDRPLFKLPDAEPFDEDSLLIQSEIRAEDIASCSVQGSTVSVDDIKSQDVKTDKRMPKNKVKFVHATDSVKTDLGTSISVKTENTSVTHAMPLNAKCHKACGVLNCMSCAFNVMYAYFNNNHASSNKHAPRQHINKNFKPASPVKTSRQEYVVRPKTAHPSKPLAKMVNSVSMPKPSKVKAVYRVKCPVLVADSVVTVRSIVLPDKGQYFKSSGPKQTWVPRKV